MKFNDSEEDYFLHDFNKSNSDGDAVSQQSSSSSHDGQSSSVPSFDFTEESGKTETVKSEPKRRRRHGWFWFFTVIILILAGTVAIRYFVPYVTESRVRGYVTLVEKRGIVFPTFEGELVSESQLADTSRIYSRDVYFSIPDDELALKLQQYQGTGRPVTITCKRYYGTLPWRGASNTIMVGFTDD